MSSSSSALSQHIAAGSDGKGSLYLAISAHGYGHLVQIAPVIDALLERLTGLRLTIQSELPHSLIAQYIRTPFQYIAEAADVGMLQDGALDVLVQATLDAHRRFHRDWPAHLARQRALLRSVDARLVLADVPYLTLAAARQLDLPAFGLCSLTWVDILRPHLEQGEEAADWFQQMQQAHLDATGFIIPIPGMPMEWLPNRHQVGPIVRLAPDHRRQLRDQLGLQEEDQLFLVNLGGISTQLPFHRWQPPPGVHCLIRGIPQGVHPNLHPIEALEIDFANLMASCDLLVTKPGYGTFAEAGCRGLPVLYVSRPNWPEEPFLVEWLHRHAPARELAHAALEKGDFLTQGLELLAEGKRFQSAQATGTEEAAAWILEQSDAPYSWFARE